MAFYNTLLPIALLFVLGVVPSTARMTLYRDTSFRGPSVTFTGDVDNIGFGGFNFNDEASSMIIRAGRWQLFEDAGFTGFSSIRGPGRYPTPQAMGIGNDKLSSVRRLN